MEAGLTLVAEAQEYAKNDLDRARGLRNGLMLALLAHCPIRLKNFAALEIGHTFKEVHGSWWLALPRSSTSSTGRTRGESPEFSEPRHRRVFEPITTHSAEISGANQFPLDLR